MILVTSGEELALGNCKLSEYILMWTIILVKAILTQNSFFYADIRIK